MPRPHPSMDSIRAAAQRLAPYIAATPLLSSPIVDEMVGGHLRLKAECLQLTGSFKIRGALNRVLQLTPAEQAAGVVAYSSGNHAQGVAMAAKIAGVAATIVMPADAPALKIARTRRSGAEVVTYDRYSESREEICAALAEEKGAVLVPPFDDPDVISGQGTVGLEIAEAMKARGEDLDQVLVCCSGGGLATGITIAMAEYFPNANVVTVEPDGFDDMKRSLATGAVVENEAGATSICDALLLRRPGGLTYPALRAAGVTGVSVSDEEAMSAMRFAADEFKVVVEPGGAVALAAALNERVTIKGRTTAVILSGGNVDPSVLHAALQKSG